MTQTDKNHAKSVVVMPPSGEPVLLSLNGVIALFIQHLIGAGRRAETIAGYQRRFRRFKTHSGFAGELPMSAYTAEDLDRWAAALRGEGLSDASRLGYIQAIKTLFGFAFRRGYIERDPSSDLVRPRLAPSARNKVMHHKTLFALLDVAWAKADKDSPRDLAIMLLLADTGMRRRELAHLKVSDLEMDKLEVHISQGKTGDRLADYTEGTRDVIRLWLQHRPLVDHDYLFVTHASNFQAAGQPLSPDTVNSIMRRLAAAAGITGRHNPHSLRHLVGQWLTDRLGNLEIVRQKLGHASITTTARFYAHQDISRVKAATQLHSPTLSYRKESDE